MHLLFQIRLLILFYCFFFNFVIYAVFLKCVAVNCYCFFIRHFVLLFLLSGLGLLLHLFASVSCVVFAVCC